MPSSKTAVNEAIGRTIRAARKEQGFTQEAFALKAGIDRSYMGAIERGEFNLTVETLLKITTGLSMSASELLDHAGL
ncbi:MAG TPA: helix-turn-helix transcriptional regulator [Solirubrobacteraceae bacterium]|nr:helix-turn-helix transcriptional regulator [Solirubrobacteraceae bacterium]